MAASQKVLAAAIAVRGRVAIWPHADVDVATQMFGASKMAPRKVIETRNQRVVAACSKGFRKARSRLPSTEAAVQTGSSSLSGLTIAVVSLSSTSGRAGGEAFTSSGHSGTGAIGSTVTFACCFATSAMRSSTTDRSRYIEPVTPRSDGSATCHRPIYVRLHRSSLQRRACDRSPAVGSPRWRRSRQACAGTRQIEPGTVG